MCSNYLPVPREALAKWDYPLPDFEYGEAYPGRVAPFLPGPPSDRWTPGTFGLMPHWAKDTLYRSTYNARSETVAEKPAFRSAWKALQFCVIPVQAFYEPNYENGRTVRWRIERADREPFGLAGIWEQVRRGDDFAWSFSILTINADEHPLMRRFHAPGTEKRSVVVLPDDAWHAWLSCRSTDEARRFLNDFAPATMGAEPDPRSHKTTNNLS